MVVLAPVSRVAVTLATATPSSSRQRSVSEYLGDADQGLKDRFETVQASLLALGVTGELT